MIKIWKGPELEGFDLGIETLFIAANEVISTDFIIEILSIHNIKRVYLGAGRTNFLGFNNNLAFINFCKDNNIAVVIEINVLSYSNDELFMIDNNYVQVIYTVRVQDRINCINRPNSVFKYDDYNNVLLINPNTVYRTNLDNLNGMLYDCDTIIYES